MSVPAGTREIFIAVVDDDLCILDSFNEFLQSAGCRVRIFASAEEFLRSGELNTIDCLISDIGMPGLNGWELEAIVDQRRPELPMILISGLEAAERHVGSARPDGSARVLFEKPCSPEVLLEKIRAMTAGETAP
jgi:FixJ family two-component response regulator